MNSEHIAKYLLARSGKHFPKEMIDNAILHIGDQTVKFDDSRQKLIEDFTERYQHYIVNRTPLRYEPLNSGSSTYMLNELLPNSGIFIIEKFLSHQQCSELVNLLETSDKKHLGFTSDLLRNPKLLGDITGIKSKQSIDMDLNDFSHYSPDSPDRVMFSKYNDLITKRLSQIANNFLRYYLLPGEIGDYFVSQITLRKYIPNTCGYSYHNDFIMGDKNPRFMSFVLYLNDVIEGGETKFLHQKVRVQPRTGRLLVFPPTHLHIHTGLPPVSNSKYIVTSFFHRVEK